jgi:signal transduction histidine kinase/AraC-like DNA-binding protein/ABC-type sugar transport system substrate-binding protein/ActR/RegA family two-component response regulator
VLAGWQYAWTATPLSYLDPIFRGACLAARTLDCHLFIGCGMGAWTSRAEALRPAWPISSSASDYVPIEPCNTDAFVAVNPLHSQARSRYLQGLIAAGHPVLYVGSGEPGPAVVADNRSGIHQAMDHLVDHGHSRIAFIAGSPEDMEGDTGERLRAYHNAIAAHGLPADPRLVAWGRHVYDGGASAMREILASGATFTGIVASNDESALGAMQALREAGIDVPREAAIIGFDDRPESAVQEPSLSSVRIPLHRMGYCAIELLYEYLTGRSEGIGSATLPTRLVARDSCGCRHTIDHSHGLTAAALQQLLGDQAVGAHQLAKMMAGPVVAEAHRLTGPAIEAMCRRLIDAFEASLSRRDPSRFRQAQEAVLRQVAVSGEDLQAWQASVSVLKHMLVRLPASAREMGRELLDSARIAISASVARRNRQQVVDEHWRLNRLGTLTARLLAALDETLVYEVLAEHLPAMGIRTTWVALFDGEREDPPTWATMRVIVSESGPPREIPGGRFPPKNLVPADQPLSLALFPLTGPRGQLGFVVFDAEQLDLCGAIAQELATALNRAQLYREANEGRRLAEEASELQSRFLSTVSHELRTPLNLIVGLSGILLGESDGHSTSLSEQDRRDLELIQANAQHLGGLIGDVLDLAGSDSGQLRLARELVDLREILHVVAETGHLLASQKGLAWRADLPESGPIVWGDRTRLSQVVLNLINNAVKFTAHGEVRLDVKLDDGSVTVSVSDTGMGIPPDEQQVIFDEFRRSGRSIAHGIGGLGLGLAISRRLVMMHGGTIGVRSPGDTGSGSTVYFTLPTAQLPATDARAVAASPLGGESVLVLTKRAAHIQRLQERLARRGRDARMVFLEQTSDWLQQLVASPPGAVVVDTGATPRTAWSVLRTIKGHPRIRHLPVLFCSFSASGGSVLELDYLTKPVDADELRRALDQHWLAQGSDHEFTSVLVVDDDPDTLGMHARVVQAHSASHRVYTARDGFAALEVLQREHIDLVLLDLMMPGLDGFGVLEAMRDQTATRDIPVIVLTGQVLTEREMMRLDHSVTTVLSKGIFSLDETLAHVDAAAARSRRLGGEAQRLVRQAMAYIHRHYPGSISRATLAQHVALSEDYLTACFRNELGVTPITYLNRYRVNQAKHLLRDTAKSVTEISSDVGFSDSGYFSRVFRREVGLSPTAYRRS